MSPRVFVPVLLLIISTYVRAQETTPTPPADTQKPDTQEQKEEEKSTGMPEKVKWKFNFDTGWVTFGFGNSLYTAVRPDPSGNLSSNRFERFIKPGLSG